MEPRLQIDPMLLEAATQTACFIKKHHPQAREWSDLLGWCIWGISYGFVTCLRNDDGRIVALLAMRPVKDPADGNLAYKHDAEGECIFVDFLMIEDHDDSRVWPTLTEIMRERFGPRKKIAFTRLAVHDYEHFLRNTSKKNRIGVPNYV